MNDSLKILLVEDNPGDARLIQIALSEAGGASRFDLTWVDGLSKAFESLEAGTPDAILLDLNLPDSHGISTVDSILEKARNVPIIILTGLEDEALSIQALRLGAQDYLVKGQLDSNLLKRSIRYATERKHAAEELQASQRMLEEIINTIPVRVFWKDTDLVYLGCNTVFAQDAGFTDPMEIIGKDDYQMGWRDQAEMYRHDDLAVIASGSSKLLIEEPQTNPEGNLITLLTSKVPLRSSNGEVIGILGTYMDISERKRAEQEIDQLAKFPSENPNPVLRLSREGIVIYANAASDVLLRMWGCAVGDSAPLFWCDLAAQALVSRENKTGDIEFDGKVYSMFVTPVAGPGYVNLYASDITERKRAERSIAESEKRYRTALNNMMEGCQIIDYDWRYIYVNDAVTKQGRKTPDELLMHTMMEVYPGIEDTDFFHKMQLVMENRIPQRTENQFFFIDGTSGWFDLSIQPVPEGIFILSIDLTERKQAEEQLRDSEERYRSILDNIQDGYFELDIAGNLTFFNPALVRLLGYPANELMGMNNRVYMTPDAAKVVFQGFNRVYRTGIPEQALEWHLVRPDGTLRSCEISVSLIKAADGSIQGFRGTARDVTERKQAEENILLERNFSTAIIDGLPGLFYIYDDQGKFLRWNKNFETISGYSSNEILTMSPLDFFEETDKSYIAEKSRAVFVTGQNTIADADFVSKNKTRRRYSFSGKIFMVEEKRWLIGMAFDITEREISENKLRFSAQLLDSSADSIMAFDLDGNFIYLNEAAWKTRGYTRDEMMALNLHALDVPMNENFVDTKMGDLMQAGLITFEAAHRCKDGSVMPIEVSSRIIELDGGQMVISSTRDITERKLAEEELQKLSQKDEQALRLAHLVRWEFDLATAQFVFNDTYYTLHGMTAEEAGGNLMSAEKFASTYVHPQDSHMIAETIQRAIETNDPNIEVQSETRILRADGGTRDVAVWIRVEQDSQGRAIKLVGVNQDITERKQAEELMRQQSEQLRLLYEASQQLNRTLDLAEINQAIFDFMSIIAPNDGFVISAFDPQTQLITCRAYWMDNKWLDVSAFPPIPLEAEGKGTQSIVIRTGQALLLNDYQAQMKTAQTSYFVNGETNEVEEELAPEEEDTTRSALIVPLKNRAMVTGVIQVMSYRLNAYTEDQLKLLESLALHIASAEQNARLFAQVQSELNERKHAQEEIKKQLDELQRWHNATLGRETRILDLKREVNELLGKAGQTPRYPSAE